MKATAGRTVDRTAEDVTNWANIHAVTVRGREKEKEIVTSELKKTTISMP